MTNPDEATPPTISSLKAKVVQAMEHVNTGQSLGAMTHEERDEALFPDEGTPELVEKVAGHWESAEGHEKAVEYSTKQRTDLCHGELTDFALANRQYMAMREDLDLTAWQTAAKERIRWLSVQLALAQSVTPLVKLREALEAAKPLVDSYADHADATDAMVRASNRVSKLIAQALRSNERSTGGSGECEVHRVPFISPGLCAFCDADARAALSHSSTTTGEE